MVGEEVGGYVIEDMLGQGAFADVYVGRHPVLCNQRALKVLLRRETHLRERFRQEARILASLHHPSIPRAIDLIQTKRKELVLVMELAEGQPVHHWVDQHAPSREDRLSVFEQVLQVVVYLHEQPVVHRDLKPTNLLVRTTPMGPRVSVIDFGIACDLSRRMTSQGQVMGTPGYTAPEQLFDASMCTDRADVYALGTLLHGLLTGYLEREPDGTLNLDPVDPPFASLIREMTAIDPEQRPSAAELWGRWQLLRDPAPVRGPTLVAPATTATPAPARRRDAPETWQGTWPPQTTVPDRPRGSRRWAMAAAALLCAGAFGYGVASASGPRAQSAPEPVAADEPVHHAVEVACVVPETEPVEPVVERVEVPVPVPAPVKAVQARSPAPKKIRWPFKKRER